MLQDGYFGKVCDILNFSSELFIYFVIISFFIYVQNLQQGINIQHVCSVQLIAITLIELL